MKEADFNKIVNLLPKKKRNDPTSKPWYMILSEKFGRSKTWVIQAAKDDRFHSNELDEAIIEMVEQERRIRAEIRERVKGKK